MSVEIRGSDSFINPKTLYSPKSTKFTIQLHHGGNFNEIKVYVGGSVHYVNHIDPDKFSIHDLRDLGGVLGCENVISCWYKVPSMDMVNGLRFLETDSDILAMLKWVPTYRVIEVFLVSSGLGIDLDDELGVDLDDLSDGLGDGLGNGLGDGLGANYNLNANDFLFDTIIDEDILLSGLNAHHEEVNQDKTSPNVNQNESDQEVHQGKTKLNEDDLWSDTINSEELLDFSSSDDEEHDSEHRPRYSEFNEERDMKKPQFELGMLFATAEQFRAAVREYSIMNKKKIKFVKNEKWRVRAKCAPPCEWMVFASKVQGDSTMQIKTINLKHKNCRPAYQNRNVTANWLSKHYLENIKSNPDWPLEAFRETVRKDHVVGVSRTVVYKAKRKAMLLIDGSHKKQFGMLWDYRKEIKRAMPESTVVLDYIDDENPRFKRFYCCLGPLKRGFVAGCRTIICLDGCFLKGPYPGQLLSAVGLDANNGIYPFAYAMVEKESKPSWAWFLRILCEDIGMQDQQNWTFMSDQQKGLVPALKEIVPNSEHRYCVRHHHNNFKKEFKGKLMKDLFWKCATATTMEYFNKCMEDLKKIKEEAFNWLDSGVLPQHWSRSHFSPTCKSDILINNHCEVFNAFILEARDKPIISMMERIRNLLMARIRKNRDKMRRQPGPICPNIQKKIDNMLPDVAGFICQWSGDYKFQVSSPYVQFVVDLRERTCSCRKWELSGVPCIHAISAILHQGDNPTNYVDNCYSRDKYLETYQYTISPLNGAALWPTSGKKSLREPIVTTQPGRPKKQRKKEEGEKRREGKLGKHRGVATCSKCGNTGHNQRSCKGQSDAPGSSNNATRPKLQVKRKTKASGQTSVIPSSNQSQN